MQEYYYTTIQRKHICKSYMLLFENYSSFTMRCETLLKLCLMSLNITFFLQILEGNFLMVSLFFLSSSSSLRQTSMNNNILYAFSSNFLVQSIVFIIVRFSILVSLINYPPKMLSLYTYSTLLFREKSLLSLLLST